MEYQILMTSPYPQMTRVIMDISNELNIPIFIIEGTMKEAALKVKQLVENDPSIEVIISRAGTYEEIADKQVNRPIIHCDNSDFDILEALWDARKYGDNIGFLTFQDAGYPYKTLKLNEILGFNVKLYPYHTWEELVQQIDRASTEQINVVIGGGLGAMELVREKGMRGINISTSRRTIARAILQAKNIANYRIQAREKVQQLNSILNITEEAIIVTDKNGGIIYFNPSAESVIGIPKEKVIGLPREEIFKIDTLNEIMHRSSGSILKTFQGKFVIEFEDIEIESNLFGKVYTLKAVSKIQQLESKIRKEIYYKGHIAKHSLSDILYRSSRMEQLILKANKYADTDSTILITGESGTGKELFAQGIHQLSKRKEGPFVAVNCASLPASLLESELFGYEEGSFTGAKKGGKPGVFELAHGGTIFLDEIGEISNEIQAMLLRVLQEKEIMRVGGDRVIPINVRIIAASNKNLWENVQQGIFRRDLLFRINVLRLHIPPLRERIEDIPLIVDKLLHQHKSTFLSWEQLPIELKQFFDNYDWPGNIRQLENVVERLVLNMDTLVNPSQFIEELLNETTNSRKDDLSKEDTIIPFKKFDNDSIVVTPGKMEEIEKQILKEMLRLYNYNRTVVADKLGISRTTLWKKVKHIE